MTASVISAAAAVIAAIISAIAAIIVARLNRSAKEQDEKINQHNEWRVKEAILQGQMIAAICELDDVTAIAVQGGHTNGNMVAAREKVKAAKAEYDIFMQKVATSQIMKED